MFIQQYSNKPKGYKGGNRFTNCPQFGDTQNSISIKFIYLYHKDNQIIRITYKDIRQTFLEIINKYKASVKYAESNEKQLIVKNIKSGTILGLHERLQFYKEEIQDSANCYFVIVERTIKKISKNAIQDQQKINEILKEKKYKEERFYDPADKFKFTINMNNTEIEFEGYKEDTVQQLKCNICKKLNLNLKEFQIIFAGKPLNNDQISMQHLSIAEGSSLHLIMKAQGGCFSALSRIRTGDNSQTNISQLKKGDRLLSYNQRQKKLEEDYITTIHKTNIQYIVKIVLQNKICIECSPTHKFYTSSGWKNYQYDETNPQNRLSTKDKLINSQFLPIQITNIQLLQLPQPQQFYHISTHKNHTFIINNFITHNMQIKIISNQDGVQYFINTNQQDTILEIKKKIYQLCKIPVKEQVLLIGSKELKDGESISDYAIDFKNSTLRLLIRAEKTIVVHHTQWKKQFQFQLTSQNYVHELKQLIKSKLDIPIKHQILFVNNIQLSHHSQLQQYPLKQNYNRINLVQVENDQVTQSVQRFMSNKMLNVKIKDNQSVNVNYSIFKEMTVQKFISALVPNSKPNYSLMVGGLLVNPSDRIYVIQQNIPYQTNECRLVTNYDRLMFYNIINTKETLNKKNIINSNKAQQQIMKNKYGNIVNVFTPKINTKLLQFYHLTIPDLIESIQYFTCQKTYEDLDSFLWKLKNSKIEAVQKLKQFNFCSVLTRSLLVLPNYIGLVHRVIQNLSVSQHYKNEQTFYWSSFMTTNINQASIKPYIRQKSTIFHIKSLTGRAIGKISNNGQDEVVILPYTYFFIENIIKLKDIDEVWLCQIPAPLSFTKNVIVWVDDNPLNNIKFAQKYQTQLQILQITSTKLAEIWMKQFGWILKQKGINYKTISDMVRLQNKNIVYEAGINLLQMFHNNYGLTTPILIFCEDVARAKQNIIKRKITPNRISSVTKSIQDVYSFIENHQPK